MATNGKNDQRSYIYLGLAGETGRGRVVQSGLYRLADGSDEWQPLQRGLPGGAGGARPGGASAEPRDRLRRHAVRALSQRRPRRALGEGRHRRPRPAGLVDPVPPARSRRDVHRLRELRDLPQRRCRRALDAPAGQRALPGDHHRTRRQSGEAGAEAGRQRQPAGPPVRRHRGRRHAPLHRWRRALGEPEPRPVSERRCGRHARRAGQPLAAGHGVSASAAPACSTAPMAATTGGTCRSSR